MSSIKYFGIPIDADTFIEIVADKMYLIESHCKQCISRYPFPNPLDPDDSSSYSKIENKEEFNKVKIECYQKISFELEFVPDELPLDKKIKILKECPSIMPFFRTFDLTIVNYSLFNNVVCILNNCTMDLERPDVTMSLIKWVACTQQYDGFYFDRVCNLLGRNIEALIGSNEVNVRELISHFWNSFFNTYGKDLNYLDVDNISGHQLPKGCYYQNTPMSRFLELFDIEVLETDFFKKIIKQCIDEYDVLPNYLNAILRLKYGDYDEKVDECHIYFMCYSLMKAGAIEKLSLDRLSSLNRKRMLAILNDNKDSKVIKKTLNYLKLKYPDIDFKEILE